MSAQFSNDSMHEVVEHFHHTFYQILPIFKWLLVPFTTGAMSLLCFYCLILLLLAIDIVIVFCWLERMTVWFCCKHLSWNFVPKWCVFLANKPYQKNVWTSAQHDQAILCYRCLLFCKTSLQTELLTTRINIKAMMIFTPHTAWICFLLLKLFTSFNTVKHCCAFSI